MKKIRLTRKTFLKLLAAAVALTALAWYGMPAPRFEKDTLHIKSDTKLWEFTVEIAETPRQHRRGLMFRRELLPGHGMLFIFPEPQDVRMWMKNTSIPLDMLFIDKRGGVVHIVERAEPYSLERIGAGRKVAGVLELPGGTVKDYGLRAGDFVRHGAFGSEMRNPYRLP